MSIPVKSPKKKSGSPTKSVKSTPSKKTPSKVQRPESFDEDSDDFYRDPDLSDFENDFHEDLQPSTPPTIPISPKKSVEKNKGRQDLDEDVNNVIGNIEENVNKVEENVICQENIFFL